MRRAPVIAILGPDGSGKSTLIEALGAHCDARRVRWRRFHWRVPWTVGDRPWTVVTDPHARPPRGPLASVLKLAWYLGTAWPCWLRNVVPWSRAGGWTILDRGFADLLCDPRRYRYGGPRVLARMAAALMPRADRVLVLVGDAQAIAARKAEVPFDELRRQIDAYRALARQPRVTLIDCGQPPAQVAAAAIAAIGIDHAASPGQVQPC